MSNPGQPNASDFLGIIPKGAVVSPQDYDSNRAKIQQLRAVLDGWNTANEAGHRKYADYERMKMELEARAQEGLQASRMLEELERHKQHLLIPVGPSANTSRLITGHLPSHSQHNQNTYLPNQTTATIEEVSSSGASHSPPLNQANKATSNYVAPQPSTAHQREYSSNIAPSSASTSSGTSWNVHNHPQHINPQSYSTLPGGSSQMTFNSRTWLAPQTMQPGVTPYGSLAQSAQPAAVHVAENSNRPQFAHHRNHIPIASTSSSLAGALGQREENQAPMSFQPKTVSLEARPSSRASAGTTSSTKQSPPPAGPVRSDRNDFVNTVIQRLGPDFVPSIIAKVQEQKQGKSHTPQTADSAHPDNTSITNTGQIGRAATSAMSNPHQYSTNDPSGNVKNTQAGVPNIGSGPNAIDMARSQLSTIAANVMQRAPSAPSHRMSGAPTEAQSAARSSAVPASAATQNVPHIAQQSYLPAQPNLAYSRPPEPTATSSTYKGSQTPRPIPLLYRDQSGNFKWHMYTPAQLAPHKPPTRINGYELVQSFPGMTALDQQRNGQSMFQTPSPASAPARPLAQPQITTPITPPSTTTPAMPRTPAQADRKRLARDILRSLGKRKRLEDGPQTESQEGPTKKLTTVENTVATSGAGLDPSSIQIFQHSWETQSGPDARARSVVDIPMTSEEVPPTSRVESQASEAPMSFSTMGNPAGLETLSLPLLSPSALVSSAPEPAASSPPPLSQSAAHPQTPRSLRWRVSSPTKSAQSLSFGPPGPILGSQPLQAPQGGSLTIPSESRQVNSEILSAAPRTPAKTPLFLPSPVSSPRGASPLQLGAAEAQDSNSDNFAEPPPSSADYNTASEPQVENEQKGVSALRPKVQVYVHVPPTPEWVVKDKAARKRKLMSQKKTEESVRRRREEIVSVYTEGNREESEKAVQLSSSRLQEKPCKWRDCDVVMNSEDKLSRHAVLHADGDDSQGLLICLWEGCPRRFSIRSNLAHHLRSHSRSPLPCAYSGCDETLDTTHDLVLHHLQHQDKELRSTPSPFCPSVPLNIESLPKTLPAYMVEPRDVRQASISKDRHNVIGPWVLRNIFGPVNLGPKKHNASVPLPTNRRAPGNDEVPSLQGNKHDEYDFLSSTSSSKMPHFEDLPSTIVSNLFARGMVLFPTAIEETESMDDFITQSQGGTGEIASKTMPEERQEAGEAGESQGVQPMNAKTENTLPEGSSAEVPDETVINHSGWSVLGSGAVDEGAE